MGDSHRTTQPAVSGSAGGAVLPATRVRYQVLLAACSVAVLIYIHRVGFARALPKIQEDLHLRSDQVSWLTALFLLAYGAFEVPGGLLGDRLGVRDVLPLLVLGWSLVTGCVALVVFLPAVGLWALLYLLLLRFLFGMFQAGAFPSLSRMMADWMPLRERGGAQGFIWMSSRLGGMVVPLLLGWLMALYDWKAALWIVAAAGVVWCVLFWPWFRNRPEQMSSVSSSECHLIAAGRPAHAAGHGSIPWRRMFRSRSVWALCLTYGCVGFAGNFFVTLLPVWLSSYRRLSERETDWLSSLPFASGAVACLVGGLLSDWIIRRTGNRKWGRRLNGSVSMVLGGVAWLCILWVRDTPALAVVLCLIFFCNDLGMAPAWASCADVGERYAGTLGGAMNMVGNISGALGNLVAGLLFGQTFSLSLSWLGRTDTLQVDGNTLLFVSYACAFWLAALCWQGVDVTRTLAEDS